MFRSGRQHIFVVLGCVLGMAVAGLAHATEADDILKKVEATMTQSKDQVSTMKMTLEDSKGQTKVRELSVKQKGADLRLMKFLSPAEVKGVGFLVLSDEEMYLYMPEFGKVRRIASHVKNENFMGTDFSYSDLGSGDYTDEYQAKIIKQDAKVAQLELRPRSPDDTQYGKLVMTVDLVRHLPTKIEFYSKKSALWKVLTQEEIEKISGYWVAKKLTMKDLKKKHSTVMELSDMAFDTGLKDKDFSKRKLKRSR